MSLKLADRIRETTTSTGTGTIALGGAVAGFRAFSSVLTNGDTTYYVIVNSTATEWEVGVGTYSSNTLTRTTVLDSTNSNALVNFNPGTKAVFIAQPAGRAVYSDGTSIVSSDGVAVGTTGGGTGVTSYTAGDTLYYAAGTVLSKLAIGTAGQVMTSSGTAPQWSTLSGIAVTTISFGSTGLTPSTATGGAVSVAGTLITSNGGTGLSSYTAGDLPYYASGTALTKLGIGTAGQVMTSTGTAPQWSTLSGVAVTTINFGSTGLTPSTATNGAVTVAGTLATANGGTNLTSFTSGGAVYATSTNALTTGILPIASGGTSQTTASSAFNALSPITTAGDLIIGNGTNSATRLAIGTSTYVLTSNGTTASWAAPASSGVSSISFGSTGLTPSTATTGAVSVAGTLSPANGGTGVANNSASTLTISGSFASTFTVSGAYNYTFPAASDTLVNLGSSQTLTSKTLTNPTVTNYVESVVAIGTVTTTNTIALTNGTVQTATLTASTACTFTMPTATAGKSFVLLLKQAAATGNGTATFTSVKWGTAGAPTITATAGKMDILTFIADGTNWYGSIAQGYTP